VSSILIKKRTFCRTFPGMSQKITFSINYYIVV